MKLHMAVHYTRLTLWFCERSTLTPDTVSICEMLDFSETVEFGGFQYLMVNSMKRWQLAEDHCRTLDSHLTSVATVEEASFLARFSTQEYNQCDFPG